MPVSPVHREVELIEDLKRLRFQVFDQLSQRTDPRLTPLTTLYKVHHIAGVGLLTPEAVYMPALRASLLPLIPVVRDSPHIVVFLSVVAGKVRPDFSDPGG